MMVACHWGDSKWGSAVAWVGRRARRLGGRWRGGDARDQSVCASTVRSMSRSASPTDIIRSRCRAVNGLRMELPLPELEKFGNSWQLLLDAYMPQFRSFADRKPQKGGSSTGRVQPSADAVNLTALALTAVGAHLLSCYFFSSLTGIQQRALVHSSYRLFILEAVSSTRRTI